MQRDDRGFEQLDLTTRSTSSSAASAATRRTSASRPEEPVRPALRRWPTASTTTRCSAPATAARSTRCRGRARCAASTRRPSPTATQARTASSPTARWPHGIPGAPNPDVASGNVPLPRGVHMRTPEPATSSAARSTRGTCSSSVACPVDLSLSAGYVGTAHQQRLRRHQPELRRIAAATPTASSSRRPATRSILTVGRAHARRATTRCRWPSTARSRTGCCSRAPTRSARR